MKKTISEGPLASVLKLNIKAKQTIIGVLLLLLALLTLLSLLTYTSEDYTHFLNPPVLLPRIPYHNWVGASGVLFNHFFILLFGQVNALMIPLLLAFLGWRKLRQIKETNLVTRWTGITMFFLLIPAFSSHLMTALNRVDPHTNRLGAAVAGLIQLVFGLPGAFLVDLGLLLVGVILITDISPDEFLEVTARFFKETFSHVWVLMEKAWIVYKERKKIQKAIREVEKAKARHREAYKPESSRAAVPAVVPTLEEKPELVESENESELPEASEAEEPVSVPRKHRKPKPQRATPFELPSISLLEIPRKVEGTFDQAEAQERSALLEQNLKNFGVDATIVNIQPGPVVTV